MLRNLIPLLQSYCSSGLISYYFIPVLCLALIATIPCIIRELVKFR